MKNNIPFKINVNKDKIGDIKEFNNIKYIVGTNRKGELEWQELSNLVY